MEIWIGYGYCPGTTGIYYEKALSKGHNVTFVGSPFGDRPGYSPSMDIARLAESTKPYPDLFVYVDSGNSPYAPIGIEKLKCPTAAYFMDAYPPTASQRNPYLNLLAPIFDVVFVAHRQALSSILKARNAAATYWLPPCCDPEIHHNLHIERIYDVGFVGQVSAAYPERVRILSELEKRFKLNDYRRPAYMGDMARIYSQSKIVVNITHTTDILNMRPFEACAAGALCITQASATNGQDILFEIGRHLLTFDQLEDLIPIIERYLGDENERNNIARAGEAHVMNNHTYAARAENMLKLALATPQAKAGARGWSEHRTATQYAGIHSMLRMVDAVMDSPGLPMPVRLWHALLGLLRRIKHA